jgi:hypothetical protein
MHIHKVADSFPDALLRRDEDSLMRIRTASILLTMFLLGSCSSGPRTTMATPASRVYHVTASVGDFMTITHGSYDYLYGVGLK